jgi:hypothetical protein
VSAKSQTIARPRYRRRGNHWWDWFLSDSIGCTLTQSGFVTSGMTKGKAAAEVEAKTAAAEWNAAHQPIQEPHRPRVMPTCAKSGEHCEVFTRHYQP